VKKTIVLVLILTGSVWGTVIVPPAKPLLLDAVGGGTEAAVHGSSTDGILYNQDHPGFLGFAAAAGAGVGANGSVSVAFAYAQFLPLLLPSVAGTFAFVHAGTNPNGLPEAVDAFAEARVFGSVFSAHALNAPLDISIDPFLLNDGESSASMSIRLLFNGAPAFSADASLIDGVLTTSGAFSQGDFAITSTGSTTRADLVHLDFSIPLTITSSQAGMNLPIELDQTFSVYAQNGGTAEVSSAPEPGAFELMCAGAVGLWTWTRWRRRTVAARRVIGAARRVS
jgi:hypothetical protein